MTTKYESHCARSEEFLGIPRSVKKTKIQILLEVLAMFKILGSFCLDIVSVPENGIARAGCCFLRGEAHVLHHKQESKRLFWACHEVSSHSSTNETLRLFFGGGGGAYEMHCLA